MRTEKVRTLVIAALFASIICVATFVVKIPSPTTNGYFNLGDCFVLLCGILLNPLYGALAAGIGSALADILSGYIQYAPATFVIKAAMALSFYYIYRAANKKLPLISKIIAGIVAETIMVLGYFGYEAFVLGYGIGAIGSVFSNTLQGIAGIAAAFAVSEAINKSKTLNEFFRKG